MTQCIKEGPAGAWHYVSGEIPREIPFTVYVRLPSSEEMQDGHFSSIFSVYYTDSDLIVLYRSYISVTSVFIPTEEVSVDCTRV